MRCSSITVQALPNATNLSQSTKVTAKKLRLKYPTHNTIVMRNKSALELQSRKNFGNESAKNPSNSNLFRPVAVHGSQVSVASVLANSVENLDKDLLIVGPGVLGSVVGRKWLEKFPGAQVVGQTNTESKHAKLAEMGIQPRLKSEASTETFSNVIFCAPPSGSEDYLGEIEAASKLYNGAGTFVFTSSTAVYTAKEDVIYTEEGENVAAGTNPRVDRMLSAEESVLGAHGCVVRLAGLYHATRGAHTYYLNAKEVPAFPGGLLNLIHYEDAASLCVAVLASGSKDKVFLGCDNNPISKGDMMEAVYASGKFGDEKMSFTSTSGAVGRRMNNDVTRSAVNWKPKYDSFELFMEAYSKGVATEEYFEGAAHA